MTWGVGDRVRVKTNNTCAYIWDENLGYTRYVTKGDIIIIVEPPEDEAYIKESCNITEPIVWFKVSPDGRSTNYLYEKDVESYDNGVVCSCDSQHLAWRGCTCGAFKYEQEQKRKM